MSGIGPVTTCANCGDAFTWVARYRDGSNLNECEDGRHHSFTEVDQSRLQQFILWPRREELHAVVLTINNPGMEAVFFRRRALEANFLAGEVIQMPTIHCVGWRNHEQQRYTFVLEDGRMIESEDINAVWQ